MGKKGSSREARPVCVADPAVRLIKVVRGSLVAYPLQCPEHGPQVRWVCCCKHMFKQKRPATVNRGRWLLCGRCAGKYVPDTRLVAACPECLRGVGVEVGKEA